MNKQPIVMISSTAQDLPKYREQVMDACMRASMFPKMMEQLTALDFDAIEASLTLVDEADIYVGLFAHRYGYIPDGHDISITEMEYEQAVERGIPRLIFLISDEVPILPKNFDTGDSAIKLNALKERLKKEQVVDFFKSPEDLRGLVLHALNQINNQLRDTQANDKSPTKLSASFFNHMSAIPAKGEPYIAHPYTLLQVRKLVGRKRELEILTDWITKSEPQDITIFNLVAIGGMGKSALAWTWFNGIAPQEKKWAGRVWWSFYETDATFENFVTRTLAYVSGRPLEELMNIPHADKQTVLLNALNQEPYLLVLDGLERILIAYTGLDAAYLSDDKVLDDENSNRITSEHGLPQSTNQSFVAKRHLSKTADMQAGQFLRKLTQVRNTRILISTRLYPADLQGPVGQPCSGCFELLLKGLSDQDALDLWRAYGAEGSREAMLPVFHTFDNHPLLIQLLAYEVAEFREAPGDFDAWRVANPDFNLFNLPFDLAQSEVLSHVLSKLSKQELRTLRTLQVISGFHFSADIIILEALLVPYEGEVGNDNKPFSTTKELVETLMALENRGLVSWDLEAKRYNLNPFVKKTIWSGTSLNENKNKDGYGSLRKHFEATPESIKVKELMLAVDLYNSFLELGDHKAASSIFFHQTESGRENLILRATSDKNEKYRCAALQALTLQWPDENTYGLLFNKFSQDENEKIRTIALQMLSLKWPNEITRDLLLNKFTQDENVKVRIIALQSLIELWPDKLTRKILETASDRDESFEIRGLAIKNLLRLWPDMRTFSVCKKIASKHNDPKTRLNTTKQLASQMWENITIRRFVRHVARTDDSSFVQEEIIFHLDSLREKLIGPWEQYLQGTANRSKLPKTPNGFPAVHFESFRLCNIRTFVNTGKIKLSSPTTLLLGNNATGKSTVLKCLALASLGSRAANEVEPNARSYLRNGTEKGIIEVSFCLIPDADAFPIEFGNFCVGIEIQDNSDRFTPLPNSEMEFGINCVQKLDELRKESDLAFAFICGYGATRTFSDNRFALEKELSKDENEWVLSLFRHDAGLVNPDVLSKLFRGDTRNIQGAPDSLAPETVASLRENILSLLPSVSTLYSEGKSDLRLHEEDLKITDLSDGYRGFLSVVGHLIRSSLKLSNWGPKPTKVHGAVLIDEIDLHLHPAWQRTVVDDMRKTFPNMQFILSTHSPLVVRSMNPTDIRVMEQSASEVAICEYTEPVHNVSVDDVLLGSYFNLDTTRSSSTEKQRRQLEQRIVEGDREASLDFIRLSRRQRFKGLKEDD